MPSFVIIGAQKCGTRWLRSNLAKHPEVFAAGEEVHFFNDRSHYEDFGTDWYRTQFRGWAGEPSVGEATPGYMMFRHHPDVVAARMAETIPAARVLAILRNPVDRAVSAFAHFVKHELVQPDVELMDRLREYPPERDPLGLIAGGFYATCLEPFRAHFADQLMVLLHDDARRDPRTTYERALQHIGVTRGSVPPDLDEVVWSNRQLTGRYRPTPDDRREIYSYFVHEIASLEVMLGRDLSSWRPD